MIAGQGIARAVIAGLRQMFDLEWFLLLPGGGDEGVGLPVGAEGDGFAVGLVLDIAHEIARIAVLPFVAEPLLHEGGVADISEADLGLPAVGEIVLVFPENLAAKGCGIIGAFVGAAKVVFAVVVDEIGFEFAFEIPGLAGGGCDKSAAVFGVDAGAGSALAEVIDSVVDVEIARRELAEAFEQSPNRLEIGAKVMAVAQAD